MNWQNRIRIDPKICFGTPCVKGKRVLVAVVLADLAAGESIENIEGEDIQAVLHFASELAQDRYIPLPQTA